MSSTPLSPPLCSTRSRVSSRRARRPLGGDRSPRGARASPPHLPRPFAYLFVRLPVWLVGRAPRSPGVTSVAGRGRAVPFPVWALPVVPVVAVRMMLLLSFPKGRVVS